MTALARMTVREKLLFRPRGAPLLKVKNGETAYAGAVDENVDRICDRRFFIFHLLLCVVFAECTFHEFLLLLYIM